MVLTDGAKLAIPCIAAGSLLAAILGRAMLSGWYDYLDRAKLDWVVLSIGAGAALTIVLFASLMPARRAASVQPMQALRKD